MEKLQHSLMPTFVITYNHSYMPPGYRGKAIKTAHTEKEALAHVGAYNHKTKTIVDRRRNVLSNIEIKKI